MNTASKVVFDSIRINRTTVMGMQRLVKLCGKRPRIGFLGCLIFSTLHSVDSFLLQSRRRAVGLIPSHRTFMSLSNSGTTSYNGDALSYTKSWEESLEGVGAEDAFQEDTVEDDEEEHLTSKDPLFLEYTQWKEAMEKCVRALNKKQKSLQSELEKAENVEETVRRAELITSNMYLFTPGVRTATVSNWNRDGAEEELTLGKAYSSASEEADALFQQARKLKRGSEIVRPLLAEIDQAKETLDEIEGDFTAALTPDGTVNENVLRLVQDRLQKSSKKTGFREPSFDSSGVSSKNKNGNAGRSTNSKQSNNPQKRKPAVGTPASNLRKFTSPGGCVVIVGRNRKGNEYLTFNIAREEDVWMHARGCPGAHVVIQQRRGSPPVTDECLQFAADLAVFYSDGRSEKSFDVTTTEPKHLLKPRGAPLGAVKLRQESGTLVGRPDNVPEECKEARDASGQEAEYRFQDKAKHRKRTKQVAKEKQEKKRANAKRKQNKRNDG